jgi:serine/threonine-protein kinase RsbW
MEHVEGDDGDRGGVSPAHLPEALHGAPAIVWTWDPVRGCTYVSEAWSRILGRDPADALGQGWAASVHPDDLEVFESCRAAMRRHEPFAAEYRLRRADGSSVVVNDQGFPLDAADPASTFLGAALAVGGQGRGERWSRSRAERLDRVTQALSSSTSVEDVADAVFVEALEALGAGSGGLGLVSPDRSSLTVTRLVGFEPKRDEWRSIPIEDETPLTRAARDGRSAFYRSSEELLQAMPHLQGELLPYEGRAALVLRGDHGVLGVLYVAYEDRREFTAATRSYFEAIADRIAKALERARLFDLARRSEARTRMLQRVTADLAGAVGIEEVEAIATSSARDAVGADGCALALVEDGRVVYADTEAYPEAFRELLPTSLEPGSSPVADVIATGESMAFDSSEVLLAGYPRLATMLDRLPFASRVFVPVAGSGDPVGVLIASSDSPARFDDEAVRLLEAIGGQCGQALERAALYRDATRTADRAAAMQSVTSSMAAATTIEEVAEVAVAYATAEAGASIAVLGAIDPGRARMRIVRHVGAPARALDRWAEMPTTDAARWLTVEEVRLRDPVIADALEPLGIGSLATLPLSSGTNVVGFLGLARAEGEPPPREQRELLEAFGERVAGAIHRANLLAAERRTRRELERALSRLSRLQSVSAAISQAMSVPEVAATTLDTSMEALRANGGGVYIADGDVLRCIAARGHFASAAAGTLDTIAVSADMAMCAAYRSGHLGWVPTIDEWRHRFPDGAAMFGHVASSSIAIPFTVEDRVLGVLTLNFPEEEMLDRPERRLARAIGHQAAVALERALLHEREMARSRRAEHLQQLIAELAARRTPTAVAASLTSTAFDVVSARAAAVALVDDADGTIQVAAARGFSPAVVDAIEGSDRGPTRSAIRTQRAALLRTEAQIEQRYPNLAEDLGASLAELPMLVRGQAIGAVLLSFDEPRRFEPEDVELLQAVAAEAAEATQRARVSQREREISRTLQGSLLPDEPVSTWNGASVATWYSAGTAHLEVGGDWYDAIELPSGILGVSIGDVVGRGLRAAAAMGQLRSALRGLALEGRGPGATLEALNRFASMTPGTELATVAYGEFDPVTGTFTYACAGHPPPIAAVDGHAMVLNEGRSPLLAAGYDGPRGQATCVLPPGSTLVLYTDGLVERRDEAFHEGIERLKTAMEGAAAAHPDELTATLIERLLGDRERTDDAALLCLRTSIPMSMSMSFPSAPEELRALRHRLRDWLTIRGHAPTESEAMVLAANEAASNAIEHAYRDGRGLITVTGEVSDGHLEVQVVDHGSWLDNGGDPSRGRGIALMRTLMDEVDVRPGDTGTTVVLRQRFRDPEPAMAAAGDQR